MTSLPRTLRHLRRYRQIVGVFMKYGFDEIVDVARKDLILRFGRKVIPRLRAGAGSEMTGAERLRHVAEELGPTFIKMGQVLSARPDMIPPAIAEEFRQLQDRVAPVPYADIVGVIRTELHQSAEAVFSDVTAEPLAAASIAQVHRATLRNGKLVVIKVQRPGIESTIEVDIEILHDLAQILARHSSDIARQNPAEIIQEFDRSIHRELDFLQEGRNIQRFGRMFADDPTVFIPTYYSDYSTQRVLVMDYVNGVKVSDLDAIESAGLDRVLIAKRGANLVLRQMFEFGFFHADPHPGNIMVLEGNVIAPLDYGMVGYLDESTIEELSDVLVGVVRKDVPRVLRSFERLGISHQPEDRTGLEQALMDFINRYYQVPLKQLNVNILASEIFEIVQKFRLKLPANLALMLKAIVTVEGLGKTLYPEFDIISEVRPYVRRISLRRFDPRRRFRDGLAVLDDLYRLAEDIPQSARDIITKIRQGELRVQFEHRNLDNLISEMDRSSNRIASALIIAALIMGSSMVVQASVGPRLLGLPMLGLIGYLLASLLGLKLVWDILRSKNL